MDDLDEKIARLERELASLRSQRSMPEWDEGQAFTVASEDELSLFSMPDLARLIFDALRVSVFLKYARIDESGRRFTYMNKMARDRLQWDAKGVTHHYDSEAFVGALKSELYQNMLRQETETLEGATSRYTQREWQPSEQFWRRSKTLEVPIFKRSDTSSGPIGFCAIAEEVEFEMFPFIHSWLREVFKHEYDNMCGAVRFRTGTAIDLLKKIKAAGISTKAGAELFANSVDEIVEGLTIARRHLGLYGETTGELYKAFSPAHYKEKMAVGPLMASVQELFVDSPYQVSFSTATNAVDLLVERSSAIKGVLLALISNAIKHADEDDDGRVIEVSVARHDDQVIWTVSNACTILERQLVLRTFADRATADPSTKGLTGVIIGEILSRAFPSARWLDMVKFPVESVDGRVCVTLHCDVMEGNK